MKRGTTPTLVVEIDFDNNLIDHIDFVFKQRCSESDKTKLEKTYPDDVSYSEGKYYIPFTEEETRIFKADSLFYMDTRIILNSGKIPATDIVTLKMNPTLFEAELDAASGSPEPVDSLPSEEIERGYM